MSYVDAFHHRDSDTIKVVERVNGQRRFVEYDADYTFYFTDPEGGHRSIFGDRLRKFSTSNYKLFKREKLARTDRTLFESDVNVVFRCLSQHYRHCETPLLQVGFFDIEVGFHPKRGHSKPHDPFNEITAISVYLDWQKQLVTLLLKPPTLTLVEAEEIASAFENCVVFDSEVALLEAFVAVIEDCDVISGWNSSAYDIPYIINRMHLLMDRAATRGLCLWNEYPRSREVIGRQGRTSFKTYDLVGRAHLDYLELYRKHNTQQLHSYALAFVGEYEVGESKTVYEGTLDNLYKKDFRRFVEYNRQDVMLLAKIDAKRKFIELSNQVAHTNTVLLKTTVGSVALIEQAILNEMHDRGVIAPDRKQEIVESEPEIIDDEDDDEDEDHVPVVGAYVATPKKGLHEHFAAVDINSLYPSTLRALNMSPETIYGQIEPTETMRYIEEQVAKLGPKKRAEAWDGIFATKEYEHVLAKDATLLTVNFEDGASAQLPAHELYDLIFRPDSNLSLTANGTLFRTDIEGIIPALLARWYSERKEMQAKKDEFTALAKQEKDPAKKAEYKTLEAFWDQRQLARKILLNSLYGALLNETMRFYDQRVGQSVTLNGRSTVRHQNAITNQIITGVYDYKGEAIIYSDTDSTYFTIKPLLGETRLAREEYIARYDTIAQQVNATFPAFMDSQFHTGLERGAIIRAGRELVASMGLFIKKKKYAVLMYDKEGNRLDSDNGPGKLKVMGLDLKRSDTPKFMQRFLEKLLLETLTGSTKDEIFEEIRAFRRDFKARPGWEKGTPKKVNALTDYSSKLARFSGTKFTEVSEVSRKTKAKTNTVYHLQAALNWNKLREMHGDNYAMEIGDGSKVIVCNLKPNPMKMKHVAFPIDEPHLPPWFRELPFDDDHMENAIIDKKLENLLGVLDWDFNETKDRGHELFTFGS